MPISAEERYSKKTARALDHTMAYVEVGAGDPILFLHGNPKQHISKRKIP